MILDYLLVKIELLVKVPPVETVPGSTPLAMNEGAATIITLLYPSLPHRYNQQQGDMLCEG